MTFKSLKLVKKLGLNPFSPIWIAPTGKLQTIVGTYWPQVGDLKSTLFNEVPVSQEDRLVIAENTPPNWKTGDRIVVLVHGLTGNYQSNYMIRSMRGFLKRGAKVLRVNLRGCGPGFGKAKNPYHCGISDDTRQVQLWIKKQFPNSPVTQIGFSLGGNLTLKMAGEDGARPTGNLDSVIAVSPPVDVRESSHLMNQPENQFFGEYFTKRLIKDVARLHSHFPELPPIPFPRKMSIRLFDELYTAPLCGFKNADDYYTQSSSLPLLKDIEVPTLILGAHDDPVVSGRAFEKIPDTSWMEKVVSKKGGHVGFLGYGGKSWRWSDDVIFRWCEENLSRLTKLESR